jgi:HEAT repeat protein
MMCGHAKELIAASWMDELDAAAESKLRQHVSTCAECAAEMAQLGAMWERLADLPAPEPGQALDVRWQATLESLLLERKRSSWRFSLAALWPRRPVWQAGIAALCLVAGLFVGMTLPPRAGTGPAEIAKLREEVESTKRMVALSLLRQQSPSERLRGVDYSVRMPAMEPEVVAALIQAVNGDPNVNVRLAAIDALSKVSGESQVRRSLMESLNGQESPMVQAALIDYVVDAHDGQAVSTLRQLTERPDLNPAVRQRADQAMRQLAQYR